jgi:N-acyl-D-aspartate/D-glutamate deacylase
MNIRRNVRNHKQRLIAIEENLNNGALAVSHSIEYQPTSFEELLDYAAIARAYQRPYFLHLRHSSLENELDGVKEAIRLAIESDAHIHIDHLNSTGGTFHMQEALDLIREANAKGAHITTCVYPYSYWATYLSSRRFEGNWQKRYGITYKDLTVIGSGEKLNYESYLKYRAKSGVLVAVPEGTQPLNETFDLAIKEEFCHVGSDGGIERDRRANNHPRGSGCFATTIRHMLDTGHDLNFILNKLTTKPTELLYPVLQKRGRIQEGFIADIVIFDPAKIEGTSSPANPNSYSRGIDYVFVNGTLSYEEKSFSEKKGMAILR